MNAGSIRGWLGGLCLLLLLTAPAALRADSSQVLEEWRLAAKAVEEHLQARQWQDAWSRSGNLIDSMVKTLGEGQVAREMLASAVSRRALAAAGLGRDEEAVWLWHAAQNLHAPYRRASLQAYGPPGELLDRNRLRLPGQIPSPEVRLLPDAGDAGEADGGIRPPRKVSGDEPRIPEAVRSGGGELLRIELVVDAQGRPSQPVLLGEVRSPAYAYVALESVRTWRLQPAEAGQGRVPVLFPVYLASRPPFADVADKQLAKAEDLLRQGDWGAAAAEAGAQVERLLAAADVADRGAFVRALTHLAVAEAGLGRREDALWHWREAQSLANLSQEDLSVYGDAGRFLLSRPLRRRDEPPRQMAVYRLDAAQTAVETPRLPEGAAALRLPGWLRAQVVVDAEGRIHEPVLEGVGDVKTVHEIFATARTLRLQPARQQGEAVAVFWDLPTAAPAGIPLTQLTELPKSGEEIRKALRGRQWDKAGLKAEQLLNASLGKEAVSRRQAALALTYRALVAAGAGNRAAAACRWRLAQDLWPALYDVDLSDFGEAGTFLQRSGGGPEPVSKGPKDGDEPSVAALHTRSARAAKFAGRARVRAVLDADGAVRESRIENLVPGALDIAARDSLCNASFAQAQGGGPAALSLHLQVVFHPASSSAGPAVDTVGKWGYVPNFHPGKDANGVPIRYDPPPPPLPN